MTCSFKRTYVFFDNWLFWVPFLLIDALEDVGSEYSCISSIFVSLGIVLPVTCIFVTKVYACDISFLGMQFEGYGLGISLGFVAYLLVGLVAHFSIKYEFGEGIF